MTLEEQYTPAGDLYWTIANRYGEASADAVYAAARTGDTNAVNAALSNARRGTTNAAYGGSASTLGNLFTQLTTDPLSAPLDAANAQISKAVGNLFKNPWVLAALIAVVFFSLGGMNVIRKRFL